GVTLTRVTTLDPAHGGVDVLSGGTEDDLLIGGANGDVIDGGANNDIAIGDVAEVLYAGGAYAQITTIDRTLGGADTIDGGTEDDLLIGGAFGDCVDGNAGDDLIFGDAVQLLWRAAGVTDPRFQTLAGTQIFSTVAGNTSGGDLADGTPRNYRDPNGS